MLRVELALQMLILISVSTNLKVDNVESFDQLMEFTRKHLPDKFFLENESRISLRNILAREIPTVLPNKD